MTGISGVIEFADVFEDIQEVIEIGSPAPRLIIRDAENPVQFYRDYEFENRYRFDKRTMLDNLAMLEDALLKDNQRELPIPPP